MKADIDNEPSEQIFCTVIVCLGSLVAGSSIAWSSPGLRILTDVQYSPPFLITNDYQEYWIDMWTPIGAAIGALPAGLLADSVGRKLTLFMSTIIYLGAWIVTIFAGEVFTLYLTRLTMGIIVGVYSTVIPMYVTEIAEDSKRGSLGIYIYLFTSFGILLDHALGIFNSYSVLCIVITALVTIFLFAQLLLPESPTYLIKSNREKDANYNLKRLRRPHDFVELEMEELKIYLHNVTNENYKFSTTFTKVNVKSLFIAVFLMIFQRVCDTVVEFVSNTEEWPRGTVTNVILACSQLLAIIIGCILAGKVGRKTLLGASGGIVSASLLSFGIYFSTLEWPMMDSTSIRWAVSISLIIYIAGFSIGLGPLPWIIVPEILAPEIKSIGVGIAVSCNWSCYVLLSFFLGYSELTIRIEWILLILAAISMICIFVTTFVLVETNGKSLQQIQDRLAGLKSSKSVLFITPTKINNATNIVKK